MTKKKIIKTTRAPSPTAPLSQATRFGNLVFVSGSAGRHPDTGQYPEGGIKEQTKQTLENIKAVLEEAGTSLDNVLKVTAFLKDLDDRPGFNEVYSSYFPADQPARTALGAGALGEGMLVEIEAIACIPD
ncbi:MAG: RidA family protein [SAR202 cluster bacterium]|jgi:2-iminobutanoate/2-iminopropanoate deaminase|nr:RidA family protein [SAR202 cluster bacterium]